MKTILITGATAGIGEATALLFAKNAWNTIITGRRETRLIALAEKIRKTYGTKVLPLAFDLRDAEAVAQSIQQIPDEWKTIDVLVNNAGLARGRSTFQEANLDDWETMIDTNIKGLLYVSRLVAPMMIQRQRGHIINISSVAGKQVYAGGHVYCATKHAVDALGKAMRIDMLKHGIRVTSINPGAVETEFSIVRFHGDKAKADKVYEGYQPLTAIDVADTIYYAATRPPHVNINEIILTCTAQADVNHLVRHQ